MNDGQNDGDSQALTVDSAAPLLDRLFSGETEETQSETQNDDETPEAPSPEDDAAPDADESEESPDSEEEDAPASDEDDEAAPADDDDEQPELIPVKANGEELKVSLDELKKGYSREKDYTQKAQKLAEERRQHEVATKAERDAISAERQRYLSQNRELEQALSSLVKEPDWDTLRVEAPEQFADIHAAWTAHKKSMDALAATRQAAEAEARKAYENAEAAHVQGERAKLLEAIPAWSDKALRDKEGAALLAYGKKLGFAENEVRGVTDHRALVTLRKAMLFDRAQEAAAKAKQTATTKIEKVKAAAPGAKGSKKPTSDLTRAKQRHAKVGSTESAAQVLSLMFDD